MPAADLRSIAELAPLVARGDVSPADLVRRCLARIEGRRELNAFITVMAESAFAEAERAADEISSGRYRGPLHGIPVSVKDLVDIAGTPTTSGSAVPARMPPADAPIVGRLREAGAIILGKTNLHEFAFGTTSDESAFGAVRNPFDRSRSAGGSSSGAAVSLVEGMCYGAIGTDTGGSIRIPSAACGTVGLKPTYGELPCDGIVPLSTTCDHVGPMTRTVADVRLLFEALTGQPLPTIVGRTRFTFGIPGGGLFDRVDAEVRGALARVRDRLVAAGHTVRDVEIAQAQIAPDVYLHIVLPEAAEYHARYLAAHAEAYSPGVRLRLEMGGYLLAEDHVRALRLRARLTESVDRVLNECDALLLPALAIPAPTLGAQAVEIDGASEPVRAAMLRLTQLFNLTGHPAIAIPAGRTSGGLPVGMQLVGSRGRTPSLLAVAEAVEGQITGGAGSVGGGTG
ncbi:MAG TPA: amidase [Vicinamibacterales bacterium]|nr:amidase [Vicinamibacterales bacterium]